MGTQNYRKQKWKHDQVKIHRCSRITDVVPFIQGPGADGLDVEVVVE